MLMLKLQYFGHLMQTADSLEKSLMLGMKEDRETRLCRTDDRFIFRLDFKASGEGGLLADGHKYIIA